MKWVESVLSVVAVVVSVVVVGRSMTYPISRAACLCYATINRMWNRASAFQKSAEERGKSWKTAESRQRFCFNHVVRWRWRWRRHHRCAMTVACARQHSVQHVQHAAWGMQHVQHVDNTLNMRNNKCIRPNASLARCLSVSLSVCLAQLHVRLQSQTGERHLSSIRLSLHPPPHCPISPSVLLFPFAARSCRVQTTVNFLFDILLLI